jgi:hypothetical protein
MWPDSGKLREQIGVLWAIPVSDFFSRRKIDER